MLFQGQEFLEGNYFRDTVPVDWDQRDEFHGIVRLYCDLIRLRFNRDGFKALSGESWKVDEGVLAIQGNSWVESISGSFTRKELERDLPGWAPGRHERTVVRAVTHALRDGLIRGSGDEPVRVRLALRCVAVEDAADDLDRA